MQRVQALTDIFRSAPCCHSNETCAPIANPPKSAQRGELLPFPKLHPGPCSSVGMRRGQTQRQIHRRAWPIYISPRLRLKRNAISWTSEVLAVILKMQTYTESRIHNFLCLIISLKVLCQHPIKDLQICVFRNCKVGWFNLVSWLVEFNVPFQHKYGYIRDEVKLVAVVSIGLDISV